MGRVDVPSVGKHVSCAAAADKLVSRRVSTWDAVIIVSLASSMVIHVIIALFIIVLVVIFLVVTIAFVDMAIVSVVEVIPICCHSIDCDSNYTIVLIIATIEALVSS